MRKIGAILLAAALLAPPAARAQDLGDKLLGGIGIDAGVQIEPGLHLADRVSRYDASRLRDRRGRIVPIRRLYIDGTANAIGAVLTVKPEGAPYPTFAFGLPWADVSLNADDPRVTVDRAGLGDIFVQPLKLGWRFARPLDTTYGSAIRAVPTTSADPMRTRPSAARHAELIACAACIGRPMPVPCTPWKSASTRSPRRRSTRTRADSSAFGNGCGI